MELSPILKVSELVTLFQNNDVLILDVSNHKEAKNQFAKEHLQGAYFLDTNEKLAAIKTNTAEGGRHPLPKIEDFARTLSDLGIQTSSHIVLYDDKNGSNAAARAWWMLKAIGHKKVQVLDGGFQYAKQQGFPTTSEILEPNSISEIYPHTDWLLPTVTLDFVQKATQNSSIKIIDVRDELRYKGLHEPLDKIAGHIPNAINIPFQNNLNQEGLFLSSEELRKKYSPLFEKTSYTNIIVHCGSGVTACHTLLALAYAGFEIPNLYVGSWSEWSQNNQPIQTSL